MNISVYRLLDRGDTIDCRKSFAVALLLLIRNTNFMFDSDNCAICGCRIASASYRISLRGVRPRVELSFPLGKHASVFQAEVFAISACVSENLKRDSQAALHALKSPRITSQVVLECTNSLAALGQRNKVRLVWFPGHSGVAGNEEADVLARKGSSDTLTGPEPAIGLPYSYPLGSIDNWTREKCQKDWSRGDRVAAGQAPD
ncbi:hypothetical protein NQ315_002089 [Exocentrus adspersus]|uniref:RNase H type-1 domain-containing protein n=1 Tax=Exocentrus adspersus TaxID=1586481 RepID=A0AAV8VEK3_9CUCU|nr:hypothetical protein NQ315_002089 [Exocentrus adspersus]